MNVINDPWLFVEYLDGKKTQISIRQAFIDAKKIKNINTPEFHNTKVYIYEVPVIQFLVTILEAVYFKPETDFSARSKYFSRKLLETDWDEKLILEYLDKWQNRFNLFDDKYPFMQDISLKTFIEKDDKKNDITDIENTTYISRSSIIAPGLGYPIFEHHSEKVNESIYLKNYKLDLVELIYILLYTRSIGTSPMAQRYPNKSICANATMFTINYGNNLFETILFNSLSLRDSNYELEIFDKPVWELESYADIYKYNIEDLYKNPLMCTFLPILPIYVLYDNDKIKDILLARETYKTLFDKEFRQSISSAYCINNPWAIRSSIKEEDKEFEKYKEWTKNISLLNLCIDITKRLPSGIACNIISSDIQENKHAKCIIYYRQYDDMKANVLSFGKYEVSQDILDILQEEKNHENAIQFQTIIKKILDKFNNFKDSGIPKYIINKCKLEFSKYAEQYFFNIFINNINNDPNIIQTTIDKLIKYAKNQVKNLTNITNNPLKYAISYKLFSGSLNKLKEEKDE